jgi:hypothetical protein
MMVFVLPLENGAILSTLLLGPDFPGHAFVISPRVLQVHMRGEGTYDNAQPIELRVIGVGIERKFLVLGPMIPQTAPAGFEYVLFLDDNTTWPAPKEYTAWDYPANFWVPIGATHQPNPVPMVEETSCIVQGCRFKYSHTTFGHYCTTCRNNGLGEFARGHGQRECNDSDSRTRLVTRQPTCLPVHLRCTKPGCVMGIFHTTVACGK